MARAKRNRRDTSNDGEVWAKIVSHKSTYCISRDELSEESYRVDDKAELEMQAVIDAITRTQRKHLGEVLSLSLLCAQKYVPEAASTSLFAR